MAGRSTGREEEEEEEEEEMESLVKDLTRQASRAESALSTTSAFSISNHQPEPRTIKNTPKQTSGGGEGGLFTIEIAEEDRRRRFKFKLKEFKNSLLQEGTCIGCPVYIVYWNSYYRRVTVNGYGFCSNHESRGWRETAGGGRSKQRGKPQPGRELSLCGLGALGLRPLLVNPPPP